MSFLCAPDESLQLVVHVEPRRQTGQQNRAGLWREPCELTLHSVLCREGDGDGEGEETMKGPAATFDLLL